MRPYLAAVVVLGTGAGSAALPRPARSPAVIVVNDNRIPAGRWHDGALDLRLDIGTGVWHPESDDGVGLEIQAFGEPSAALGVPGPMIRVPVGTEVQAVVHNTLATSLVVHGLHSRPLVGEDTLHLAAGEERTVAFRLDEAGTYSYWATHSGKRKGKAPESQLYGAIVVDEPGVAPDDRVFMIGIWTEDADSSAIPPRAEREVLVINGKSWPHTERLTYEVGDSVRWRWINTSPRAHPMHLHGYFFRVDAKGDGRADTTYTAGQRRLAVTEDLRPGQSMRAAWYPPDHPGNWVFHCHLSYHVSPVNRLTPIALATPEAERPHMAGLVMGIHVVLPEGAAEPPPRGAARGFLLDLQTVPGHYGPVDGMGAALQEEGVLAERKFVSIPGPPLVLTRGEPVDVRVVNHLAEATSIHWHGLELESESDGVPFWSGAGMNIAQPIQPGDSFTARLTLRRAGTFIYHSHLDDIRQLSRGLYGAIVVLAPGQAFDPATDHLVVAGWGGGDETPYWVVNGDSAPPPLWLEPGVSNRLRLVNIAPAGRRVITLVAAGDSSAIPWTIAAMDGAELPLDMRRPTTAPVRLQVGETTDVLITPPAGARYELVMRGYGGTTVVPLVAGVAGPSPP